MSKKVDFFLSLNALLGWHGVKTSMLQSNQDYWAVAKALWPNISESKGGPSLESLQRQIKSMSRADRRRIGRQNATRVPSNWFSDAPVHQRKLSPV